MLKPENQAWLAIGMALGGMCAVMAWALVQAAKGRWK